MPDPIWEYRSRCIRKRGNPRVERAAVQRSRTRCDGFGASLVGIGYAYASADAAFVDAYLGSRAFTRQVRQRPTAWWFRKQNSY
jgi:hypothetical protein